MTISKQKAKAKFFLILHLVLEERDRLAREESLGYTNILFMPNGRRLVRYAKKANIKLRCMYMFGILRDIGY